VPTAPICRFDDRARSEVALFAFDVFRLVVMWAPEGGPEVALGRNPAAATSQRARRCHRR
jgi:hypothetical protein